MSLKVQPLFWKIFALGFFIWLIQISPFLIGICLNSGIENSSVFLYRGEIGFAEDLMVYATQIKHAVSNPNFFRTDSMIFENSGQYFPDGNLVVLYCAFFYWIFGNWDLMLLFSSLPVTVLSGFILYKITQALSSKQLDFGSFILIASIFFLTLFSDFLNIYKVVGGIKNNGFFVTGLNKFIMGNAQRFPQNQISILLFLTWFLVLLKTLQQNKTIHYVLLAIGLVVLQYTYFFYWPFALFTTVLLLFFQWFRSYKPWLMLLIYIIGTIPFWLVLQDFNAQDFAEEYQNKMRGYDTYPSLMLHVTAILALFLAFRKQLSFLTFLLITAVSFIQFGIFYIQHFFPSNHIYCQLFKLLSIIFICVLFYNYYRKQKGFDFNKMLLINYWAIFVFVNLKFMIGFNIQPFHWVNHAFYSIFILNLIPIYLEFQQKYFFKKLPIYLSFIVVVLALSSGVIFVRSSYKFWQINEQEQQVFDYLKTQNKSVIGGNNISFLISCAVQSNHQLLTGISHTNYSTNQEAYHRLIKNFKQMGYTNHQIMVEVNKYKNAKDYRMAFEHKNDSTSKIWPDNTTLFAESASHYFENPETYLPSFKLALKNYTDKNFNAKLDFLVIYKPTFMGNLLILKSKIILENDSFLIVKL